MAMVPYNRYNTRGAGRAARTIQSLWRNRRAIGQGINTAGEVARGLYSGGRGLYNAARSGVSAARGARRAIFGNSRRAPVRRTLFPAGGPSSSYKTGNRRRSRFRRGGRGRSGKTKRRGKGKSFNSMVFKKLCVPQTMKETYAFYRKGLANQRQYLSLVLGTEGVLNNIKSRRPTNFLFNSNRDASSSPALSDFSSNYKLHLNQFLHKVGIQNRSNASMELKIYECLVRHDISAANLDLTVTSWAGRFQGDNDNPTYTGQNAQGPNQDSLSTTDTLGGNMWKHPGHTPFMAPTFCQYFKIYKTSSMLLSPNEICYKYYTCKRRVFAGKWLDSPASIDWQKGWSKMILFSWVGQPVDDGGADSTSLKGRSANDLSLNVDCTYRYYFTPSHTPLVNVWIPEAHSNQNMAGGTQQYRLGTSAFTQVIPASDTVQVPASAADTVPEVP